MELHGCETRPNLVKGLVSPWVSYQSFRTVSSTLTELLMFSLLHLKDASYWHLLCSADRLNL